MLILMTKLVDSLCALVRIYTKVNIANLTNGSLLNAAFRSKENRYRFELQARYSDMMIDTIHHPEKKFSSNHQTLRFGQLILMQLTMIPNGFSNTHQSLVQLIRDVSKISEARTI